MQRMEYIGKIKELQGKTALTQETDPYRNTPQRRLLDFSEHPGVLYAQFDEPLRFGSGPADRWDLGWHPFEKTDFRPEGEKPIF